jgi:hypothetical protein
MSCLIICIESCSEFFRECALLLRSEMGMIEIDTYSFSSDDSEIIVVVDGDTDSDGFQPVGARNRRTGLNM